MGTTKALAVVRTDSSALAPLEQWTEEQKALIKATCFPDSTDDELKLYLHVAATSGLDPLRKQIHPLRLQGRLSFVADINGLQARAAREADFEGIDCAVVYERDDFLWDSLEGKPAKHLSGLQGKPIAAWAVVHRKGMRPFVSLVRFDEYQNARNPLWREKPGVMLLKVAKSTALRLAYPEQLGSLYERAELDRAKAEGLSSGDEEKPIEASFSPEATKLADAAAKMLPHAPIEDAQVIEPAPEPKAEPQSDRPAPSPEALRARAQRVWKAMHQRKMDAARFREWAKELLGRDCPSTDWTETDIETLEAEVARIIAAGA